MSKTPSSSLIRLVPTRAGTLRYRATREGICAYNDGTMTHQIDSRQQRRYRLLLIMATRR